MKHYLQLFAQELNEALIVTVRGVLGGEKKVTLLNRTVRYGQTMNGGLFSEWKADMRHVEISTETIGLKRAEDSKTLSSLCIKRSMDEVNATDLSEDHVRTYRSVCMRINYSAQDTPDIFLQP